MKSETLDGSIGAVLANFGKLDVSTALASVLAHICVAVITVKAFIQLVKKWTLVPFAWYRIVAVPVFYLLTRRVGF